MKLDKDQENEDIESLIIKDKDSVIESDILEVPDYSYWASQEPLDWQFQVRNIASWWKVKTWYSSIPSWYTDFAITWLWFTPKAIQVVAQSWNKWAWGYADNVWWTLTQRCIYSNSGALWESSSRLFRFSGTEVWLLVSLDSNWFTVKSDIAATMIWTCFW